MATTQYHPVVQELIDMIAQNGWKSNFEGQAGNIQNKLEGDFDVTHIYDMSDSSYVDSFKE